MAILSAPISTVNVQTLFDDARHWHLSGQWISAQMLYRLILIADPQHADALHLLGMIAHQMGRYDAAIALTGRAIDIDGAVPAYHSNHGLALKCLGRHDDAIASYNAALLIQADFVETLTNRGNALKEQGRIDNAIASYGAAILYKPDFAEAYFGRGLALKDFGRTGDAAASYVAALRLRPDYVEALSSHGDALLDLGHSHDAIAAYDAALCHKPDFAEALANRANALREHGCLDAAIANYNYALRLKPDLAEAYSNRGAALNDLGRSTDALASYNASLIIRPNFAEAFSNRGTALHDLGRIDDSIAAYNAALRIRTNYAEAIYNLSFCHLLRGNFKEGLEQHEWRWRGGSKKLKPRSFAVPQWHGEELTGRRILLHTEQGLGDTIQFCRYVSTVSARGGHVILEVPSVLRRLLSSLRGVDRMVTYGEPLPAFDLHSPLMSLPLATGTRVGSIPADIPYLHAEQERISRWRDRLGFHGFKVGVVWQGGPGYKRDNQRSVPLSYFAPLSALPGVRLISLQRQYGLEQLKHLPPGLMIETLGDEFDAGPDAFLDSAAVMSNLDLIVTVDTASGHLAGALGRPVWIALTALPHWVWMLNRDDSDWYPSARLFRQTKPGDWGGVFYNMTVELGNLMAQPAL